MVLVFQQLMRNGFDDLCDDDFVISSIKHTKEGAHMPS